MKPMLECALTFFLARARYRYTVETFKESLREISFYSHPNVEHFNNLSLPWSHVGV